MKWFLWWLKGVIGVKKIIHYTKDRGMSADRHMAAAWLYCFAVTLCMPHLCSFVNDKQRNTETSLWHGDRSAAMHSQLSRWYQFFIETVWLFLYCLFFLSTTSSPVQIKLGITPTQCTDHGNMATDSTGKSIMYTTKCLAWIHVSDHKQYAQVDIVLHPTSPRRSHKQSN